MVTQNGFGSINSSLMVGNRVQCVLNCTLGSGGAFYGDIGDIQISNVSIFNNTVSGKRGDEGVFLKKLLGIGGGGGFSTAGTLRLSVLKSKIAYNVANQGLALGNIFLKRKMSGGGMYITVETRVSVEDCLIEWNHALLVGGALVSSGPIFLAFVRLMVAFNTA